MKSPEFIESTFENVYVVGSGVLHDDLVNLSKELQVYDVVKFTGHVNDDELQDLFKVACASLFFDDKFLTYSFFFRLLI
jgi:glycosyltransferase involved in cell wall biosynthesis